MSKLTFYNNKALRHLDRLAAFANGDPIMPVTLDVDLTNKCNSNCPKCCFAGLRDNTVMETEMAERVLRQAAHLGIKSVVFTGGGEATLHPDLGRLLDYATGQGLHVALVTNGLSLTEDRALVDSIIRNCTWVRISLDAGDPETYRATHGIDKFSTVLDGIYSIYRGKRCVASTTPTIGVAFLTGEDTINSIDHACMAAKTHGADYIYLRPFLGDRTHVDVGRYRANHTHDSPGFEVLGAVAYSRLSETAKTYRKCGFGWWVSVVMADGTVTWCCQTRERNAYHLGNLKEANLKEILFQRRNVRVALEGCPLFCRGDEFNRFLSESARPVMHEVFL